MLIELDRERSSNFTEREADALKSKSNCERSDLELGASHPELGGANCPKDRIRGQANPLRRPPQLGEGKGVAFASLFFAAA